VVKEGDVISIDGTSGAVYLGEVPVCSSPVVQYFEGTLKARRTATSSVQAVQPDHVTHRRRRARLTVRANADNPEDLIRQGPQVRRQPASGLVQGPSTMFLGERRQPHRET
jgi:pyruvate,orthophosphate dikinase